MSSKDVELVAPIFACPCCGEREMDKLAWHNNAVLVEGRWVRATQEYVECESCGAHYDPPNEE